MARPQRISNEQILTTMRRCVLEQGPNVPLDAVAHELGVTTPALLKRFGSRQNLMLAALRPPAEPEWIRHVLLGPDDRPLRAQLMDILQGISAFTLENFPCLSALRESGIPLSELFPQPATPERGLKALQRWLKQAKKKGLIVAEELDAMAYVMIGSLQSRAFFAHLVKRPYTDRAQQGFIRETAQFFARALTTCERSTSAEAPAAHRKSAS